MPSFDRLSADLNFNQEALRLRSQRQEVLASNIANADTPNYKARDFNFSDEMRKAMASEQQDDGSFELSRTSDRHIEASARPSRISSLKYRIPDQPSLDGNTVDMDRERVQFMDNTLRYQAGQTFMNSKLRGLKAAMQPE
ncbi:flagellar basal body rod protein FlgB [Pseudomonas aeruginosa]